MRIVFSHSKLRNQPFLLKLLKSMGALHLPSDAHWVDKGYGGCSQCCCSSSAARVREPQQWCDAWSQLFAKCIEVSTYLCDLTNVTLRYLGSEQKGRVSCCGWLSTQFNFLAVEMEDCRHRFCSVELSFPGLEVFTYGCHIFVQHPFHCLPPSISMHDC